MHLYDITVCHQPFTCGAPPALADHLVTINKDNLQFTIRHCHRSLPVAYDVSGWVRQARDHPSYRVVPQVLNESKR